MEITFLYHVLNIILLIILQITFGFIYNNLFMTKKYMYKHLYMLIVYAELKNINVNIKSVKNFTFIILIESLH